LDKLVELSITYILVIAFTSLLSMLTLAVTFRLSISILGLDLKFSEWFGLTALNNFYNYFLPLSGGLAIRGRFLKKNYNFEYSKYIAFISNMYFVNLLISAGIGLFLSCFLYLKNGALGILPYLFIFSGILISLILAGLFIKYNNRSILPSKLEKYIKKFRSANSEMWNKKFLLVISMLYLIRIILMTLRLYFTFRAVGIDVEFIALLLVSCLIQFTGLFSLTPGNIGLREIIVSLNSSLLNVDFNTIMNISIVERIIIMVTTFIIGFIFIVYYRVVLKTKIIS